MADGVELAPLRGKIILDISDFNEVLDNLESSVDCLTEKLTESFNVLAEKMDALKLDLSAPIDVNVDVNSDVENSGDIEEQIDQTEQLTETYDDAKVALENFGQALGGLRPLFNELSAEEQEFWQEWGDSEDSFNTKVLMERIEQLKEITNEYIDTLHELTGEWQQCDSQIITLIPLWNQLTDAERQFLESNGENEAEHDVDAVIRNEQMLRDALAELQAQQESLIPTTEETGETMETEAENMERANIASTALRDSLASTISIREEVNAEMEESSDSLDEYATSTAEGEQTTKNFGQSAWESALKVYFFGMQAVATGQELIKLGNLQSAGIATAQREYGQYSQGVINWANQSATAFGQSKGEALSLANQFALSLKSYGANSQEASKYSETLAQMSGQLSIATGGNVDYTEAADAFRAALGGQMYSLESLGISVTKAQRNQLALNSVWHKSFSSLSTYQQKVIDIKAIQDALNKTFGSTKSLMQTQYGQWEALTAQLRNQGATIGNILLPPLLHLGQEFIKLTSWINKLSPGTKQLIDSFIHFGVVAGAGVVGLGLFGKALDISISSIKNTVNTMKDLKNVFTGVDDASKLITPVGRALFHLKNIAGLALNGIGKGVIGLAGIITDTIIPAIGSVIVAIGPIGWILIGITSAVVLCYEAWQHNWLNIRGITAGVINFIVDRFNIFKESIINTFHAVETVSLAIWNSIKSGLIEIVKLIVDYFKFEFDLLKLTITTIFTAIKTVATTIWTAIYSVVHTIWTNIVNAVVHSPLYPSLVKLLNSIKHLFTAVWNAICLITTALWTRMREHIQQNLTAIWDFINPILHEIGELFSQVWKSIYDITSTIFHAIISVVITTWDSMTTFLSSVGTEIVSIITQMWNSACSFTEHGLELIENIFMSVWNAICSWFSGAVIEPVNFLGNMFSEFVSTIESGMSMALNGFVSGWNAITGWLAGAIGEIVSIVESIGGALFSAGENIMQDLFNGITGVFGNIMNWVSNAINNLANEITSAASSLAGDISGASNGSHYNGLDFVPFDGYSATLHKGEMVLTAEQAENYRTGGSALNNNMEIHLHSPEAIDPLEAYNRMEELSRNLANGFY